MASLKPWMLLARSSSRQWATTTAKPCWSSSSAAFSSSPPSPPSGGGGGSGDNDRLSSFQPIRRPQQNRNQQQQGQQQGRPNNNQNNMNMRGNNNNNSAANRATPLRTHMIDLFPGNYDDDDDSTSNNNSNQESEQYYDDDEANFAGMESAMAELHRQSELDDAQKQRWLDNSVPPVRVPVIDTMGRSYGRGGRKAAEARVWLTPGFGNITVNRKDVLEYFPRRSDREKILDPLVVTKTCGKFDLQCIVKGGGLTGQAGALRLGVARALQYWNPEYRPPMKKLGYLTRDARKVERKKIGRVKARKRPQWNRR